MKKNVLQPKQPENLSEERIQQEIIRWYRNTFCLAHHNPRCMIFSVPNEGRGKASSKLIATGLYPGCADLVVIRDGFEIFTPSRIDDIMKRVLFFEVKTPEGRLSGKQKAFQAHCQQMSIPYHVVRSVDEFKAIINRL